MKEEVVDLREVAALCVCAGIGIGFIVTLLAQGAGRALFEVLKGVVL